MKTKVCGLRDFQNILKISELKVDLIGFIFYKGSPRYIGNSLSFDEARQIPKTLKKVGVFVDEATYAILNAVAHFDLDYVQLHGKESAEQCSELKKYVKVIKAFSIAENFDFDQLKAYENFVDHFLFDTPSASNGGSGRSFNWQVLKKYANSVPYFLSGGIDENGLEELFNLEIPKPHAVDINSKFETEPGIKDKEKVKQFLIKLKHYENAILS